MFILKVLRYGVASVMGVAFLVLLLWFGPRYAIDLGTQREWPSWRHPVGLLAGSILIFAGAGVFVYCTGLFTSRGRGTPVPIAPPRSLVTTGLYRHSRNPIYVAYAGILVGEAAFVGSTSLLMYAMAMFAVFHVMIVAHEEPELRRRFGTDYAQYRERVPRWLSIRTSREVDA